MDAVEQARTALDYVSQLPVSLHEFEVALKAVEHGDAAVAVEALRPVEDGPARLATMFLQRYSVGHGRPDLVEPLEAIVSSRASHGAGSGMRPWDIDWIEAVVGLLAPDRLGGRVQKMHAVRFVLESEDGRPGSGHLVTPNLAEVSGDVRGQGSTRSLSARLRSSLSRGGARNAPPDPAVLREPEHRSATGRDGAAVRAIASGIASSIDPAARELRSQATLAVALASPQTVDRDQLIAQALREANTRPYISGGPDECSAVGLVVKTLAEHGVDADHPTITSALGALRQFAAMHSRKNGNDHGVGEAAAAAARRAAADLDSRWLAIAVDLAPRLHRPDMADPAWLRLAQAHAAFGDVDGESHALVQISDQAFGPSAKVRDEYQLHADALVAAWTSQLPAVGMAEIYVAAGQDPAVFVEEIEARAAEYLRGEDQLFADLILVDPTQAEASLAASSAGVALVHGAAKLWEMPGQRHRAAALVERAMDEGWVVSPSAVSPLFEILVADSALLDRAERDLLDHRIPVQRPDARALAPFDEPARRNALAQLAACRIRLGQWDRATALVRRAVAPPVSEEEPGPLLMTRPGWSYRGLEPRLLDLSDRHPNAGLPLDIELTQAVAEAQTAGDEMVANHLYALAHRLTVPGPDVAGLEQVRTAYLKTRKGRGEEASYWRARLVELHLALDDFEAALSTAQEMRASVGGHRTAAQLAHWLAHNPQEWSLERALAYVAELRKSPWNLIAFELVTLGPDLLAHAYGSDFGVVAAAIEAIELPRMSSIKPAVIAGGHAAHGRVDEASLLLDRTLADIPEFGHECNERHYVWIALMLYRSGASESSLDRWTRQAFDVGGWSGASAGTCALDMWCAGEQHTVIHALLEEGRFSSRDSKLLRRTLLSGGARYAPRPLDAVLAAWDPEPANVDLATEQIEALAAAYERTGDPGMAADLRALVEAVPNR